VPQSRYLRQYNPPIYLYVREVRTDTQQKHTLRSKRKVANMAQAEGPGGTEKINTDIITLTRFLTEEQTKHKEATGDFT